MGANSEISWTDHTFNPWIGCTHVSPGCVHCYAETMMDQRYGKVEWGKGKARMRTSVANWRKPIAWNKQAAAAGTRYRVFCSSLADVFDPEVDQAWRDDLWKLIDQTPSLDWLLLTKRPEQIARMMPVRWGCDAKQGIFDDTTLMPANVWIGTSVEDQRRADERIPHLLKVPAKVRFLSCEPLLGPLDLTGKTIQDIWIDPEYASLDSELGRVVEEDGWPIHWVIVGGESGHGARPMHPDWARGLRDQCQAAGVAYHFKQWGEYTPYYEQVVPETGDLRLAEYTKGMKRVGKHAAGRLLDGRTWDELPTID